MAKLIGTAQATTTYPDYGTGAASTVQDGNTSTGWSSGTAFAATDLIAFTFAEPVTLKSVKVLFRTWARVINIGYASAYSTNKAAYTLARTVDTHATASTTGDAVDALGKPYAPVLSPGLSFENANVIALADNEVAAKVWAFYVPDVNSGLGGTAGAVDRLRIFEMELYSDLDLINFERRPVNPVIPSPVPPAPYTAIPNAKWTRTEYATAGQHAFTPKPNTTLVMAIAVGAGAAGYIETDQSGNSSPLGSFLFGGNTKVSNADGVIFEAGGGGRNSASLSYQFGDMVKDITDGAASDWVNWQDRTGISAAVPSVGAAASAGGASRVDSVAGTTFTIPAGNMNDGLLATTTFTGSGAISGIAVDTQTNFYRNASLGYTSNSNVSAGAGTITFTPIKLVAGQKLVLNFTKVSNGQTYAYMNDVQFGTAGGVSGGAFTFTCTVTGMYVLRYVQNSSSTGHYSAITNLVITGYGYGNNAGGGSGRTAVAYLIPEPLTFEIGAGGTPITSGHTIPANAAGTRGAGGAAGGAGGDGVVVIYEYNGPLLSTVPPIATFANYNVLTDVTGTYRTDYRGENLSSYYANPTVYTHKLRPSTKTVLFVMVGAGATWGSSYDTAITYAPTKVIIGDKQFIAGSGISPGDGYGGGRAGTFSSTPDDIAILSSSGAGGASSSSGSVRPDQAVIAGRYGGAASNTSGSVGGGGTGSYAFAATQDLPEDGIIQIEVANTSAAAGHYYQNVGGAVFVFESESDFGPLITQISEQTLIKSPTFSQTQTTQVSEQVLVKNPTFSETQISQVSEQAFVRARWADTWTSQLSEQVLIKEDENNNPLQVSYADVAYIVDATDPETSITNLSQQTLVKDKQTDTWTTNSVQQILLKAFPAIFRVTQVPQQVLVAENPSVFFMNFGILENPLKHVLYDSRVARATSVPEGSVVQLEGNFAPGSYMVINGEPVGLSSPIRNNDQVSLHSGVTNYYQRSINVYAYYLTNGETTRELVGLWNVIQPDLSPTVSRAYSVQWTAKSFLFLPTQFAMAQLKNALFAGARSAVASFVEFLMGSGNSKTAQLVGVLFAKANAATVVPLQSVFSKALASTADSAKSMFTKAQTQLSNPFKWDYTQAKVDKFTGRDFVATEAAYGSVDTNKDYVKQKDSAVFVIPEYLETHAGYGAYENKSFIDLHAGDAAFEIKETIHTRAYSTHKSTSYEYNDVGKSTESGVTWTAVLGSSFARPFAMSAMDTIAYSVLGNVSYEKGVGISLDSWVMPSDTAEITKAVYGTFASNAQANPKAKYGMFEQEAIPRKSENFDTFPTSPIWLQRYSSTFKTGTEKTQHHSSIFNTKPIYTTNNHKLAALYPYLKSELVVKGNAPALTYMGFNTRQDALDFTENFYGVSVLNAYNGFIYNLDVDRSFICEISYVGPISGLMQGG